VSACAGSSIRLLLIAALAVLIHVPRPPFQCFLRFLFYFNFRFISISFLCALTVTHVTSYTRVFIFHSYPL
jgi:hypothetical protein